MKARETFSTSIKLVGVGISLVDYEEFKNGNYFKGDVFINQGKSIYSDLNLKKNGCCNCFGLTCKLFSIGSKAKEKKITNNLSGDLSQNGGEFIVDRSGLLLLSKLQVDPTDKISYEELEEVAIAYRKASDIVI